MDETHSYLKIKLFYYKILTEMYSLRFFIQAKA